MNKSSLGTTIGNNIKSLREKHKLTQEDLAKILGYKANSALSSIESGKKLPSPERILEIANYFNVSTDFLFQNDTSNVLDVDFQEYKKTTEYIMNLLEKYQLIELDNSGKLKNQEDFLKSMKIIEKLIEFKKSK